MKNRISIRTVIVILLMYLLAASWVAVLGPGVFVSLLLYSIAAILASVWLLRKDLREDDKSVRFKRFYPFKRLGSQYHEFEYVFFSDQNLLPQIFKEINEALSKIDFKAPLENRECTDHDKRLLKPESRRFLYTHSELNTYGTQTFLVLWLNSVGHGHSVRWWVLVRGKPDLNSKFVVLAWAPLALPFWLYQKMKGSLDLASKVRSVYVSFYNSMDLVTGIRMLNKLVFDSMIKVLEEHHIDTSDIKQQRSQVLSINVSGGKAVFGNIVQAFRKASVNQAGSAK